ncbi:hypothetical protein SFUMM280S_06182 [Streptomyces fumanus]
MASPVGALVGSMVIGLTEAFTAGYQSDLHVLGEGFGDVAPYAVMVLVLLARPAGLFAAKERPVSDLLRRGRLLIPVLLLCALPFYLDAFWLRIGLFSMAAAIGAVGLGLLSGTAGQLSLAIGFFLAVGAYGYVWLAGDDGPGLLPAVALVLAVLLAGAARGLLRPVAGRVKGIYLGVATLALVFLRPPRAADRRLRHRRLRRLRCALRVQRGPTAGRRPEEGVRERQPHP